MRNILLAEQNFLHARTIATMYETYDCEVALASDAQGVVDVLARRRIDVLIMSSSFCRASGEEAKDAVRAVQPELPIAVFGELDELHCGGCPSADFYVRPTHFYTDLRRRMAP